jgi:hypothetical protein
MKPHAPPPMDAPENVWRAYMADQLAAIHQCFEDRADATDRRVDAYHEENKASQITLLAAIEEVKAIAQPAFKWVSVEDKARERAADVEAGKQLERERWLTWWHRAEGFINELWQWVGKPAIGVVLAYLIYVIRKGG